MKKLLLLVPAVFLACCVAGFTDEFVGPPIYGTAENSWITDHLEVGTRLFHVLLLEDQRREPNHGSFVGSVTMLKEDQNMFPFRLFVQCKLTPYVGLGASYDRVSAEAWDHSGTDGTTILSGPLFYLLGRYPNESKYTPYCEVGIAVYSAQFVEDPNWDHSNRKAFNLEGTQGYYFAVGCDMELLYNWSLDFQGRYMNVDVDGVYTMDGAPRDDIIFTVSHLALGVGVKYSF